MNNPSPTGRLGGPIRSALVVAGTASLLLAACASAPGKPAGAANARSKLTHLQADAVLAGLAPVATRDAESAVQLAEVPLHDASLGAHRVYLADRKVDTARALAETRYAEDQQAVLHREREAVRLDARTEEANAATRQAMSAQRDARAATRDAEAATREAVAAQAESARQKSDAEAARSDASVARQAAETANDQALEMQRQIASLQAKVTDRGLVLNLGDVLFASGNSELRGSAHARLDKLVLFLGKYGDRTVTIEGHTDSVGNEDFNQGLSERRAQAVRSYLTSQGVSTSRTTATGKGESDPIADNGSQGGRQQNRRVEVIIGNPVTALR
jgi:outer membrane protein OmpA-like peptidoglycan-associated protein